MQKRYKKCNYVVEVPLENGNKRYMSTLWMSIVDLEPKYQQLLEYCGEKTTFDKEEIKTLERLRELGIVKYVDEDEFKIAYQTIMKWRNSKYFSAIFCVTLKCNFNCVYCYEKGNYDEGSHMSRSIAISSLKWVKKITETRGINQLRINFFGGEPLLNYGVILLIMEEANRMFLNTRLNYYMSTNGYLLSLKKIKKLRALGLEQLQITLDGLPKTHNKRRPTVTGKPAFDKIWGNMLLCVQEGVKVDLLTVCDEENVDNLIPLVDLIDNALTIYVHVN